MLVLSLPYLKTAFKLSLSEIHVSKRYSLPYSLNLYWCSHLSETFVSKQGFIGFWLQSGEWIMIRLNEMELIPSYDVRMYDSLKSKRYLESTGLTTSGTSSKYGTVRNEAADVLFAPSSPKAIASESSNLAGELGRIGSALAERGEKLNQMQEKTSELSNQSSSFAAAAKLLAKQQESKWF